MAATTSQRCLAKCMQCGTAVIFPGRVGTEGTRGTIDSRGCPVCGHEIEATDSVVEGMPPDAKRIEEFFSRFC